MAINPGDFEVTLVPSDPDISFLECVIGNQLDVTINFSNNSLTDPLYNLNIKLILPDGVSYVSAQALESSNIIDASFNNVVTFINLKDLYPLEVNYEFKFTLNADAYYRSNSSPVPFDTLISGVQVEATCDTAPRGNFDVGNQVVLGNSAIAIKVFRFQVSFTAPTQFLKGAGFIPGDSIDATQIFNVTLNLINNSRSNSNISFVLKLANGLRYIGVWSTSGTNASNFINPIITSPSPSQNYVSLAFNSKTLSTNSRTQLTFQVAIWDKFTLNGIENSGDTILYINKLDSTILMTGNGSSYSEDWKLTPLEINIYKTAESNLTDVGVLNEFTLTYQTSEYLSILSTTLVDILPDGLRYDSSDIIPSAITTPGDGTTNVIWGLGSLPTNYTGTITLYATTQNTYHSGAYVYSTDELINTLNLDCIKSTTGVRINAFAYLKLNIVAPIISKDILNYYYNDMSVKPFQIAAIGDFIDFIIVYDARRITAKQKNVILFDYPPLSMYTPTIPDVTVTGDFPPGVVPELTSSSGYRIPLGDLNGGIYFTLSAPFELHPGGHHQDIYNLAKVQLINSYGNSKSIRDNALVSVGEPHLILTNTISDSSCIINNKNLLYSFDLINYNSKDINYTTDGFNVSIINTIPSIYSISTIPSIITTGTINYNPLTINNNVISLYINKFAPSSTMHVSIPLLVNNPPIMSESYDINISMTNSTSQQSINSYRYNESDFPLNNSIPLSGCTPTIYKVYTPSINKLGDYYNATIYITIPKGVLSYNNKIKDSILTTDGSYLSNVLLNGVPSSYSLSSNNLQVLLPTTLDTSSGIVNYTLSYNNRVMAASPINYQDDRYILSSIDWSNTLTYPEVYNKSITTKFTIVVPGINMVKYQSNVTQNISYDTLPINGYDYDEIKYKLSISNVGKAPAYNIVITDTIPNSIRYDGISGATASFNPLNRVLTMTVPYINNGTTTDVIINATIINDGNDEIARNSAALSYKANTNLNDVYGNSNSNIVRILKDDLVITKYQRNSTAGDSFTVSEIRCVKNQEIQYKVYVKNTLGVTLSNITITDIFPNQFDFVSFEPFPLGDLSVSGNTVSCTLSSLPANGIIEYIYTIKCSTDTMIRSSSISTIRYKYLGGSVFFSKDSNRVYVSCSALGRGYKIY